MAKRCLVLSALVALVASPLVTAQKVDTKLQDALVKHIEDNGGTVGFELGKDCDQCPRGAIATRDFKKDDVIAEVPFKLAVKMGLAGEPSPEGAVDVILERFKNPQHNKTYELFWATQPDKDEVLTPDLFTDELIDMLQSDQLASIVRNHRGYTEAVYHGTAGKYAGRSVTELLGGDHLSLQQFYWYTALVVSRAFSFWYGGHVEAGLTRTYMFPLMDMINHAEGDKVNCHRWDVEDTGVVRQIADKDIKKGEQLYQVYHESMLHRPDMALLVYGFVLEQVPAVLAAVDLPTFKRDDPYQPTPPNDDAYGPRGELATGAELGRLLDIKRGWPTSLEEDEELLEKESGEGSDWRKRTLLQYRVQRKRAVINVIKTLLESLAEL